MEFPAAFDGDWAHPSRHKFAASISQRSPAMCEPEDELERIGATQNTKKLW